MDTTRHLETISGRIPFKRITGTTAVQGIFTRLQAINGNVVFDNGCETFEGDTIAEDDTLLQGNSISGIFKQIKLKSGVLIAYISE